MIKRKDTSKKDKAFKSKSLKKKLNIVKIKLTIFNGVFSQSIDFYTSFNHSVYQQVLLFSFFQGTY